MSNIKSYIEKLRSLLENENQEPEEECSICFSSFVDCELSNCKHEFCKDCITHWLSSNNKCPLCRTTNYLDNIVVRRCTKNEIRNVSASIIQIISRRWLEKRNKASIIIQSIALGWLARKNIQTIKLYHKGYNKLNEFQKNIFEECLQRNSGGLSLPMGSGKTLISLVLSLHKLLETRLPILIVCSKSLVTSWVSEINKFFGNELAYQVIHKSIMKKKINAWKISKKINLYITTPDNLGIFYKNNNIHNKFIGLDEDRVKVWDYKMPKKPLLSKQCGSGVFYSQEWGMIVVDEAQKYTNILTQKCRAICSLYSKNRWVLSGTMFDEPKPERILGYYMLINNNSIPFNIRSVRRILNMDCNQRRQRQRYEIQRFRCLVCSRSSIISLNTVDLGCQYKFCGNCWSHYQNSPGGILSLSTHPNVGNLFTMLYYHYRSGGRRPISSSSISTGSSTISNNTNRNRFTGLKSTLVYRDKNPEFIQPQVNYEVVSHDLSLEESIIYTCLKDFLIETNRRLEQALIDKNTKEANKLRGYVFALIIYLREILVCPMAPITNIIKNAYNSDSNKELYQILTNKLSNLGLDYYFENPESIKSTRIKKILEKIQYHNNERIVLFSCFKQPLYIIKQFISNRQLFIMESKMSSSQRGELIEKFKNSTNGILLLTYSIGAEGLNLQCSSTIMLIDFYWNSAKTNQAIARIYRYGQTANLVNIYMFISNTGIEKIIMKKQKAKQKIIQELFSGVATTKIPKLSISEIVKLIEKANNKNLLNNVYQNYDNVYNPNIYNNQPVLTI